MSEITELVWSSGQERLPTGSYPNSEFLGLELAPKHETYKQGIIFRFRICEGEHKDKIATVMGAMSPTPKNKTGRLLECMGVSGKTGTAISIKELIGRKFNVVIGNTGVVEMAFPVK